MSRNQRLGIVAVVLVVAVAAFVIAKPGDDNKSDSSSTPASTAGKGGAKAPAAKAQVIKLTDHAPQGGVQKVKVAKGDEVNFVVTGDKADTIHLHGYNVEKEFKPGGRAVFKLPAKLEGVFEIESHVAEHEGKEPLIGRLYVESS